MSAIVEIDEQNGDSASPAITHSVGNSNMGSSDTPNLDPAAFPITPGQNSFEKWHLIHLTDLGASSRVSNIQIWRTGAMGKHAIHLTNARKTNYAGAAPYTTPRTGTSTVATEIMPASNPGSANLGIGGSLTGSLTEPGYSDFLVQQIQTATPALAGSSTILNYQYDEIA